MASDTPRTDYLMAGVANPLPAERYWIESHRQLERELSVAQSQITALKADAERYKILADRVLACDYGDNDAPGEQIGWRIRHDLLPKNGERQPAFMFGASIDAAVDSLPIAMKAKP